MRALPPVHILTLILALLASAPTLAHDATEHGQDEILDTQTRVVESAALGDLDSLVGKLADKRVIYIGETHDRYEDHLNQLAIIRGLNEGAQPIAVGMEFFQQPFQPVLDAYIAGRIDEHELLRQSEYFDRWRYDYRLYRPILRYAREHQLPLVALNLSKELTDRIGDVGFDGLSESERAKVPAQIDRDDPDYRARVEEVFNHHPHREDADLERFLDVQLAWDEGMAERAARYLRENPERKLVVLAGSGHLELGQGIPSRVTRRLPDIDSSIVLNGTRRKLDPAAADFLLYPRRVEIPASGLMGVLLDTGRGDVRVKGFSDKSGAKTAGMKRGDSITRIGEVPIESYADVRIALIDSRPGQRLPVQVQRRHLISPNETVEMEVELR